MSSGKIVLGVLAGVAIGAVAGILLAPESGSNTRKNISGKSDAYAKKLNQQFKGYVNILTDKFGKLTDEAETMAENGANTLTKGMDHLTTGKKI